MTKLDNLVMLISFFKKILNVNRRTLSYIGFISVILYICMDLLLGRIYPKIHTPTKYGWSVTGERKVTHNVQDTKDNYREVNNQYYLYGFKRWPIKSRKKPRVLIVGDSFTEMNYVSNGEEWYAYIEREFLNIDFFVFGGGGYGTLQEYMAIDDHFDKIKPDGIILQFCSNDYNNNYYELDKRCYPFNNHFIRPYWEHGKIIYRLPLPYPRLREYSFSADRILHCYDKKRWRDATIDLSEYRKRRSQELNRLSPHENELLDIDKKKSVDVTKTLARMIRGRSGDIPIYFFNACGKLTDNDRAICEAGKFIYMEDIVGYMEKVEKNGVQIKVENDGHWNYYGNKYAGEKLTQYFKKHGGIIPQRHQTSGY